MRNLCFVLCCLWASACQTTTVSPEPAPRVDVRAITKPSQDLFDIDAALNAANAAMIAEDYARASEQFRAVIFADKDHISARLGYANALLAMGEGTKALAAFTALPEDVDGRLSGIVLSNIMTGQSVDAEVELNAALEFDLSDPRLWNALGQFYDGDGRTLAAQDAYLRALATGKASSAAVNNLGVSYLMAGRTDAAIAKFEQAHAMNSVTHLHDNNRRMALVLRGDMAGALSGLSGMRAANTLNDAGYIAGLKGDAARAKTLFKAAMDMAPRYHAKAHDNLQALSSEPIPSAPRPVIAVAGP